MLWPVSAAYRDELPDSCQQPHFTDEETEVPKSSAIFEARQKIYISIHKLGNPDESKIIIAQNPTTSTYECNNLSEVFRIF